MFKCLMPSIILILLCQTRSKRAFPVCRYQPDSERLKAPSRLLQGFWVMDWEAIVPLA